MTWARLDDTFYRHPKVQDALDQPDGLAALGLWTLALARSYDPAVNSPLVATKAVVRLGGTEALASVLVEAGLWDVSDDGYLIHDWQEYRPPLLTAEARSKGGQVRAAKAARSGGRFAPNVENVQQEPADQQPPGGLDQQPPGPAATSRPGTNPYPIRNERYTKVPREGCGEGPTKGPVQEAIATWSPVWTPILTEWGKRFRLPPTEAQREALWDAVDNYPSASLSAIREAKPGATANQVVEAVLARFHGLRNEANYQAGLAEVRADARKRTTIQPRAAAPAPTPISAVLPELPM